ncbi:MAG: FkbM family methyltransferase [Anaerolineae bacterium]|nr:FkbM family methyltransferase [Anaerolineae bacterium]
MAPDLLKERNSMKSDRFIRDFLLGVDGVLHKGLSKLETGVGLTREHIVWAYRLFLDREPESEAVVSGKLLAWKTTKELRMDFMTSLEFRAKNPEDLAYTNESHIVITELDNRLRLFVDLADVVIGLNIIRGNYEQNEVNFVRRVVKPGQNVLDIGANIGFFTIIMASLVGPSGKVYAFEPLDQNADLLELSIAENDFEDRIVLERAALGQSSGSARLIFLEVERALNSGGGYLFREGVNIPDGHELREVKMIALDDYPLRRPISFIKIDVEGTEPLVFRGATKMLQRDRPLILSELNPVQLEKVSGCKAAQLITEMQALGYHCHVLDDNGKVAAKITDVSDTHIRSVVFLPG